VHRHLLLLLIESRGSVGSLVMLHTVQERAGRITMRALGPREGSAAYRLASVLLSDLLSLYPGASAFYASVRVTGEMFASAIDKFDQISRVRSALALMRSAHYPESPKIVNLLIFKIYVNRRI
jgi:hypothetical protein